jgi:hypothetical protein
MFLIGVILLAGCSRKLGGDTELYGPYAEEAQHCMDLVAKYDEKKPRHLSSDDIQKMEDLQATNNPVSGDANGVLAVYANQDPKLKQDLIARSPVLESSQDAVVQASGVMIAYWYKLKDQEPKIHAIRQGLKAKSHLTFYEQLLLDNINQYYERTGLK